MSTFREVKANRFWIKFDRRTPFAWISLNTSVWRGLNGPNFSDNSKCKYPPMMASGAFSSCAAEANASRQQLQWSSVTNSSLCFTVDTFAGGIGTTPFFFLAVGDEFSAWSGIIPDLCSTGILSSNSRPGFSQADRSSGNRVETLYRGRDDLNASTFIFNG